MKSTTIETGYRKLRSASKVWFAIPVAQSCVEEAERTFCEWNDMGYSCIALVDGPKYPKNCVCRHVSTYLGWAWATNLLADFLGSAFDWLVIGGHDVFPDPDNDPRKIAYECVDHFKGTMGVMQPCGDVYGALADKSACVSAWVGRKFCNKHGPLHDGYFHFWADTELKHVAEAEQCLWWRDDLTQFHDHHLRKPHSRRPKHLEEANHRAKDDQALFLKRKAEGFGGVHVAA